MPTPKFSGKARARIQNKVAPAPRASLLQRAEDYGGKLWSGMKNDMSAQPAVFDLNAIQGATGAIKRAGRKLGGMIGRR